MFNSLLNGLIAKQSLKIILNGLNVLPKFCIKMKIMLFHTNVTNISIISCWSDL